LQPQVIREMRSASQGLQQSIPMSEYTLDSKYRMEQGTALLSGLQALVRLTIQQRRADRRQGLNTAMLVSGYPGSPLAGLDQALCANQKILREHNVFFIPGVNEDLGATMVFGSQIANLGPRPKYDGVLGMWFGKAPGVDRCGDIFKHANFAGAGHCGGVLAVAGDDPSCKSATIPSHSEPTFFDAQMPIVYPGNVQEILDFGRLGFEMSRYSGLWTGFKVVTDVADGFATVETSDDRFTITKPDLTFDGRPWRPTQNTSLLPPFTLDLEHEIYECRLAAAREFGLQNKLNTVTGNSHDAWLGIVAAGKTYYDVREALLRLGFGDAELCANGIRLLKIGMPFPIDKRLVQDFARDLEQIVVIEEKRAFIELFIRSFLYDAGRRPIIVGKQDEAGDLLVPPWGELDVDSITRILFPRLLLRVGNDAMKQRRDLLSSAAEQPAVPAPLRTAFFCSGCPHNSSTNVPEGSDGYGGVGCHALAIAIEGRNTSGVTHMGGEGAQWAGIAPFTERTHAFQNLGDGTFFHSGELAIRQAVAAGTNITYKLLYNNAIAMTGGQPVQGSVALPELTRILEAEGVRRIIVTSDDPAKYSSHLRWAPGVEIWDRTRLEEAQRVLRDVPGVTVLIHDQPCAAELRRQRKRGKAHEPKKRVWINERVCEGCGDCGVKSNCLSVVPINTEFGRKTQIHQSSCNKDYSCLAGECPAFVTFEYKGGGNPRRTAGSVEKGMTERLPEPTKIPAQGSIFMVGIGGTGVVTVSQILGTAALLENKHVRGLDQTGLSQKAGPVSSHVTISSEPFEGVGKIPVATADCYLVFDVIAGVRPDVLQRVSRERTTAVISTSEVPTGEMIHSMVSFPALDPLIEAIRSRTLAGKTVILDSVHLAESLIGDSMQANLITLGAAYQAGALPVTGDSIERAIALNGVAMEANTRAFRIGRLVVADRDAIQSFLLDDTANNESTPISSPVAEAMIQGVAASGELRRLLEIRVPELIEYQGQPYAQRYLKLVDLVAKTERVKAPGATSLTEEFARYLFKLMAYKDEYEVARLHLGHSIFSESRLGSPTTKHRYLIHPPLLRALGLKRKLAFGEWFRASFYILARLKWLRGTRLDLFGYSEVRRTERELINEYASLILQILPYLSHETHAQVVELARLPDMIRGYEHVKLANIRRFREQARILMGQLQVKPERQYAS
jgi:indolepyruvate ferredoxin oxidoreductase